MKMREDSRTRKILAFLGLIVFLPFLSSCGPSVKSQKLEDPSQLPQSQDDTQARITTPYIMEVGDELTIQVWGFDDLKRTSVYVDSSGEITYPMAGRIKIAGQTLAKAEGMLAARLKKYIVDPQVDIIVSTSTRMQILVTGEVISPGVVSFRRPLTIPEAVTKAGWYNRDANQSKVLLIRRANNKHYVFAVDTGDMYQDASKIQQFYLQAGDVVYVPTHGIVKLERFLQHIQTLAQPFLTVEQAVVLWPQFINALSGKTATSSGLSISTPSGGSSNSSSSSSSSSK
jgi:polysaccharide export outer membrane protein